MILPQGYDKVPADYTGKVWIEGQAMEMLTEFYNQLAASQAREKVLRDALERLACLGNGSRHGNSVGNKMAIDALTLPADDTALKAALAAERERCASVCLEQYAEAIRTLGDGR